MLFLDLRSQMIKSYLHSKGTFVCVEKVAQSLQRVAPESYEEWRQNTLDRTNPIPYNSMYFGHKLHIDQNEKLIMFGVTHFIAVDGHSGMIVSNVTVPIKNNRLVYEYTYR